jgi:hypothetical protein
MTHDRLGHCLACLTHPTSLAAIAVLLINDHLLKPHFPSMLTGKLSDFAGLYFFPFLLAVPLSLIGGMSRKKTKALGALSIVATGLSFILIKTSVGVNSVAESIFLGLTGSPSSIIMDPSDLVALSILLASWMLWRQYHRPRNAWIGWLAFGAASLATTATSCVPIDTIARLSVDDGVVYAYSSDASLVAASYTRGDTWDSLDSPTQGMPTAPPQNTLPYVMCSPGDRTQCFRVSRNETVELSYDAGSIWLIAWQVPPGRRLLMDRLASSLVCGKSIDLGPYDLAIIGTPNDYAVVAAMGNEGVVVRDSTGKWERHQVGSAVPTPFHAQSLLTLPWVLLGETMTVVGLTAAAWLFLNFIYWVPVMRRIHIHLPPKRGVSWVLTPLAVSFAASVLATVAMAAVGSLDIGLVLWPVLALFIGFAAVLGYAASSRRLARCVSNPAETYQALRTVTLAPVAMIVAAILPLASWAFGIVPFYSAAVGISTVLFTAMAALCTRSLLRRAAKATAIAPTQPPSMRSA